MNDGVIPATKGNAAQVFPAERRQMVGRREACNRRHTCCRKHNTTFLFLNSFAVWTIVFYLTRYLMND